MNRVDRMQTPPGLQHAVDAIDRALRIVEMLEHFDRQHGVERVAAPFELVQIAADVRLLGRIDIEPHDNARPRTYAAVRRGLRADVQHDARFQPLKLAHAARDRASIRLTDRMFSVGMRGQSRRAQRSKHA